MAWKYTKELQSVDLISQYEHLTGYALCSSFKRCVIANNGGRPSRRSFDTAKTKEREIKSLLSFNGEDRETVWKAVEWNKDQLTAKYVPFGIDSFGNIICFDKGNDKIIFFKP